MRRGRTLSMGDAPFILNKRTSASLIWATIVALLPALAWGVYSFGARAAVPIAASILGALVGEAIASALMRRFTLWDGSAFLTGLLIGMAMPPGVTLFIPAVASLFAVSIVKGSFGGLGSNWMNPALSGIAFAILNWPAEMSAWTAPPRLDALAGVSGATPLAIARSQAASSLAGSGTMDMLASGGMKFTGTDSVITAALNRGIFSPLGADLPSGYVDLLIGNKAGAPGELSAILILAASVVLISRRVIRWEIPAMIIGAFSILTYAFGGIALGNGLFSGDVLFSIFTGSFLLVAFFMAPDPVTSPSSRPGMIFYGAGVGALCFLLRTFGSSSEGSAFAVILMNCAVPAIAKLEDGVARRRAARALSEVKEEGGGYGH
jgi:Na+-translocating ferredoxin:NAD+ oxidoreductase subunit D